MKKIAVAVSILGVFAGVSGAMHGPGEMLQGNNSSKRHYH